jgi:NADPH:quinone reductase-like Zn-dependent oxidoreductase
VPAVDPDLPQRQATVDRTYPFDEAPQALAHVEGGRTKGKMVIRMV